MWRRERKTKMQNRGRKREEMTKVEKSFKLGMTAAKKSEEKRVTEGN